MTRIYTKTGDQGMTSTASGHRLTKSHALLHAQGDIDELNCQIGFILALLHKQPLLHNVDTKLTYIQHLLFHMGAQLSLGEHINKATSPTISREASLQLETDIDAWTNDLPKLKHFILPGGSELVAHIHLARAVCRRAERQLVSVDPHPDILRYINRLSDWLFTLARWVCNQTGIEEIKWDNAKKHT